jgi:hypothetical protein
MDIENPPLTDNPQLNRWLELLTEKLRHIDKLDVDQISFREITDPAAPTDGYVLLYAKDATGNKEKLSARFETGAVQDVASEP